MCWAGLILSAWWVEDFSIPALACYIGKLGLVTVTTLEGYANASLLEPLDIESPPPQFFFSPHLSCYTFFEKIQR
jgi:hypothetical protein